MNRLLKFTVPLSLFIVVILGFAISNGFCASRIEDLRKAAEKGDTQAQFELGLEYGTGKEVPKDDVEAAKWFHKAAEQGIAEAQYLLGFSYGLGIGVPKNNVESVKWLRRAAEQEHADAQFYLGGSYDNGTGVAEDDVQAVKWYRKAAAQGHAKAEYLLGLAYDKGKGVPKNTAEAAKWLRRAAEHGIVEAQVYLGVNYATGAGVPKDELEALAWFNIAAALGNEEALVFRKSLENRLGSQASLFAQQRSKEILKEIESAKQNKTNAEESVQRQPNKPSENAGPRGSGTGAFVTDNGLILTAAHVVGNSANLKVVTNQGLKVARVVKVDAANDLALLKCEGGFQAATVRASSGIKLGQSVFTIGFPNIGFQGFSPKMTKGEISSLSGFQDDPRHWQISVPVQPGNSGGPLFDEAGNVVGIILAKLDALKVAKATGDLTQNVNYAIKSTYVLPLLEGYTLSAPLPAQQSRKLENVVEKVQGAVVLILVY